MRVYFGITLAELAQVVAEGGIGPAPLSGHAVTPALREWFAAGDAEELEYAATGDAARTSVARLSTELSVDPRSVPRRVVVAAEVADAAVRQDAEAGRSAVVVDSDVPFDTVQAVHVDGADAEAAIRAAAEAYPRAVAGDADASFTLDEASGYELLWYARQEVPDLLH